MRRTRVLGLTTAALVTTLALGGCADDSADDDGSAATPDSTPTESETASEGGQPVEPTTSAPTESEPADDAVEVDVTIQDGEISPLGETVEADPGQQIRLVVDSDTHDEFHVHSDPEHEFVHGGPVPLTEILGTPLPEEEWEPGVSSRLGQLALRVWRPVLEDGTERMERS